MNTGMIPTRYATALLAFATESGDETRMYETAKMLIRNFDEQVRLRSVLENPVVKSEQKKQLILLASNQVEGGFFERFINLLLLKNREAYIYLIMLKYIDMYRAQNNIYKATVISAAALDATVSARLSSIIEKKRKGKLELEMKIQPDILGGFILDVDDTRWDASLKRQLQQIKNELITK